MAVSSVKDEDGWSEIRSESLGPGSDCSGADGTADLGGVGRVDGSRLVTKGGSGACLGESSMGGGWRTSSSLISPSSRIWSFCAGSVGGGFDDMLGASEVIVGGEDAISSWP